jgi:CBS domain-containing protein
VLGIGFYLIYAVGNQFELPVSVSSVLFYLGWINLLLAVFNMVPAFPLDGGRVLRSFLWKRKGDLREATRLSSRIGSGFGTGLILLGVLSILFGSFVGGMWWFLIGLFLRQAAKSSFLQMEIRNSLKGEPVGRFMNPDPIAVPADISISDLVEHYIYVHHFHMFPVVEDSRVLGSISTQEIKKIPKEEWGQRSVGEVLVPSGKDTVVSPETDAMDVLSILQRTGRSRLLVIDGTRLAGVISLKDLLKFLSLKMDLEGGRGERLLGEQSISPHGQPRI